MDQGQYYELWICHREDVKPRMQKLYDARDKALFNVNVDEIEDRGSEGYTGAVFVISPILVHDEDIAQAALLGFAHKAGESLEQSLIAFLSPQGVVTHYGELPILSSPEPWPTTETK